MDGRPPSLPRTAIAGAWGACHLNLASDFKVRVSYSPADMSKPAAIREMIENTLRSSVALRFGASLSDASDTVDRAVPGGRLDRPHCTPDRSMADGAARPAIRHREPVGCRRQ